MEILGVIKFFWDLSLCKNGPTKLDFLGLAAMEKTEIPGKWVRLHIITLIPPINDKENSDLGYSSLREQFHHLPCWQWLYEKGVRFSRGLKVLKGSQRFSKVLKGSQSSRFTRDTYLVLGVFYVLGFAIMAEVTMTSMFRLGIPYNQQQVGIPTLALPAGSVYCSKVQIFNK